MHKHLRADCSGIKQVYANDIELTELSQADENSALDERIIKSNASSQDLGNGFAFRNWTYAMVRDKLDPAGHGILI